MFKVGFTILIACVTMSASFGQKYADYSKNVVRNGNRVYISGLMSFSQPLDTCNPASTYMILKYYGIDVSFDQLIVGNYHSTEATSYHLKRYNCSMPFVVSGSAKALKEMIKHAVDNGILLKWSVDTLKSPDAKKKSQQKKSSGHARIINGYILDSDKNIVKIIYSDSWGKAALNKEMNIDDAMNMTTLIGVFYPNTINPLLIKELKAMKDAVNPKNYALGTGEPQNRLYNGKYRPRKRSRNRR